MFPISNSYQLLKIKTEKALQAINQYENIKRYSFNKTGLVFMKSIETTPSELAKSFDPKSVVRMQLLPKTTQFHKIKYNKTIEPKIIVRNVRGGPFEMIIYYDKQSSMREMNGTKFHIESEIIIKLDKRKVVDAKWIYIKFINENNLTMFNFRMDYVPKKKGRIKTELSEKSLEKIIEELNERSPRQESTRKARSLKKIYLSEEDLTSLRPENKKREMERKKQLQQQKKEAALIRKQQTQIYKQKENEAKKVAAKCKNLVEKYQELVKKQTNLKAQTIKINGPAMLAIKFLLISNKLTFDRELKANRIFMVQNYKRKFARKMLIAHKQLRDLIPEPAIRQKYTPMVSLTLLAKSFQRKCYLKSGQMITETILKALPGITINQVMNSASRYRRYVRILQKRWRTKFEARMQLLVRYIDKQLISMFKKYPQFKPLEEEFRKSKAAYSISYQYQVEISSKLKDNYIKYEKKIQEIAEFQKMNEQIKLFNQSALKKRQRQLLDIPKKPAQPQHRFFREIATLKNMMRGWFEVEYRRLKKVKKEKAKINKMEQKK